MDGNPYRFSQLIELKLKNTAHLDLTQIYYYTKLRVYSQTIEFACNDRMLLKLCLSI